MTWANFLSHQLVLYSASRIKTSLLDQFGILYNDTGFRRYTYVGNKNTVVVLLTYGDVTVKCFYTRTFKKEMITIMDLPVYTKQQLALRNGQDKLQIWVAYVLYSANSSIAGP